MGLCETVVHGVRPMARETRGGRHVCRLAIVLALLFLLSGCHLDNWWQNGCKVGPNYCPPSAPVATHWIETGNPNVQTAPAANGAWWRVFNDPVLDQLVDAAARQNLPLRVAVLRICQARATRHRPRRAVSTKTAVLRTIHAEQLQSKRLSIRRLSHSVAV